MGAPTKVVEGAGGHKFYTWEDKSEMRTPIVGTETYNSQTGTDTIVLHGNDRVPLDCTTNLEVDATGLVVGNSFDGVACFGVAPSGGSGVAATATSAPAAAPAPPAVPAPSATASEPAAVAAEHAVAAPAVAEEIGTEEAGAEEPREERRKPRRARPLRERRQE